MGGSHDHRKAHGQRRRTGPCFPTTPDDPGRLGGEPMDGRHLHKCCRGNGARQRGRQVRTRAGSRREAVPARNRSPPRGPGTLHPVGERGRRDRATPEWRQDRLPGRSDMGAGVPRLEEGVCDHHTRIQCGEEAQRGGDGARTGQHDHHDVRADKEPMLEACPFHGCPGRQPGRRGR